MHETDFGRESYDHSKLAQPSSFPSELGQKSLVKGGQLSLTQLMQKSSCRRAHEEELMQLMQKISCRRAHAAHAQELMQLM